MGENKKNRSSNHSEVGDKKKKSPIVKFVIFLVLLFVGITLVTGLYGINILSNLNRVKLNHDNLGIDEKLHEKIEADKINNIVNVALFGVDEADGDVGRSDSIMIATLDPVHKKLKITSLMRDTYVNIPGHKYDKLNHAYAYGGAELSIKTINSVFGLNIKDYVKVNFGELESIIDAVGGIDMILSEEEITEVDDYIVRVSNSQGKTPKKLDPDKNGKVHMDGFQTLGYTRIRSTSNGDFDRTQRHRKVITEMFNRVSSLGVTQLASVTSKVLPYVETSLSNKEILDLGINVLTLGVGNLEQERFPRDGYSENAMIDGVFYLTYEEKPTSEQIQKYIFDDEKIWLNDSNGSENN